MRYVFLTVILTISFLGCTMFQPIQQEPLVTGYVIYREGDEVITDLGRASGVRRGATLLVFDIDSEVYHPVTDELIRVQLTPLGVIQLEEVGDISSSGKIISGEDKIEVGQFVRAVSKKRIPAESWWEEGTQWKERKLPKEDAEAIVPAHRRVLTQIIVDVDIPDANLEEALREALNKPSGSITKRDLARLTSLSAQERNISDLTALEYCINLTDIEIGGNSISNISALANLTKLTSIRLHRNQISDIRPLANLTNLIKLYLEGNQISDINPLENLANLTDLGLRENSISDISPLANLTNLRWLTLHANQISDISPLANLTDLWELHLGGNPISHINALANLTNLVYLYLDSCQTISDTTPLKNLVNLKELALGINQIADVTPLTELTKLTFLDLSNNKISDINALANLTNVGTTHFSIDLGLSNNQIHNLQPLVDNPGLDAGDVVDVRNNPLNDISLRVYIPQLQKRGVKILFDGH